MPLSVGDRLPNITMKTWDEGPAPIAIDDIFADKTVVMFGVPGAYTPTCTLKHLPGYVEQAQAFNKVGVDRIVVHSVNDPFVMNAWAAEAGVTHHFTLLADWDGALAQALGVDADMSSAGLGMRAKRYALIAKESKIVYFEIGDLEVSGADAVLAALKASYGSAKAY